MGEVCLIDKVYGIDVKFSPSLAKINSDKCTRICCAFSSLIIEDFTHSIPHFSQIVHFQQGVLIQAIFHLGLSLDSYANSKVGF